MAKSDQERRTKGADRHGKRPRHSAQNGPKKQGTKPAARSQNRSQQAGTLPPDRVRLYGLHTVRAALDNPHRAALRLFANEAGLARLGEVPRELEIRGADSASLQALVGAEAVHQGVVLECKVLDGLDASELFHLADENLLLALDQITDPHNVGAVLRSAVAMGVGAVLMTSRNAASETGVLAKSASGALDMVRMVQLRHFSKGLAELNAMGFATIGLDSEGPLELRETLQKNGGEKLCLVLGSEGKGLRQQTRETCSALARLDMPGEIKSLNVSNAAALSLYLAHLHLR
ncbi:MAG: RNA methyltransferase [Pseudomonadota bacterium]